MNGMASAIFGRSLGVTLRFGALGYNIVLRPTG